MADWRDYFPDPDEVAAKPPDWRAFFPDVGAEDEWERRGVVMVNRRTGETKPVPIEGGLPTEQMRISPDKSLGSTLAQGAAGAARSIGAGVLDNTSFLLKASLPGEIYTAAHGQMPNPMNPGVGILGSMERTADELSQRGGEQMRSTARELGMPGIVGETAHGASYLVGQAIDPVTIGLGLTGSLGTKVAATAAAREAEVAADAAGAAKSALPDTFPLRPSEAVPVAPKVPTPLSTSPHGPTITESAVDPNFKYFEHPILDKDGSQVGGLTGEISDGQVRVKETMSDPQMPLGKGLAAESYSRLADWSKANGLALQSDNIVSQDAARVYESLQRRGYDVAMSGDARLRLPGEEGAGNWVTDSGGPVYRVSVPDRPTAVPGVSLPPGSPAVVGPTLRTDSGFQTNVFSQLGKDAPEVRDHIINRSDEVAAAIGGPRSWDDIEEMALRSGTTKEEFLSRNPRYALMLPEERTRLLMVIKGTENDMKPLHQKIANGLASHDDQLQMARLVDEWSTMFKLSVGSASEYGRGLNSARMQIRAALGESSLARQTLYRKYEKQINKQGLMGALSRLDPSNPEELQAFLRQADPPRFVDLLQEWWVGSVLSGPATQERNILGNISNAVAENMLVRPVQAVFSSEHSMREVPAAAAGLAQGVRKGLARGFEILRRGYDIEAGGKLLPVRSSFARSQNKFVREVVGPVATGSLRLLSAADAVFKSMNYTAEIYAQAANMASKEGLTGSLFAERAANLISAPTEAMVKQARGFALKATFNDEVSNVGKAWLKLRDQVPGGSFLSPFVKITDRLMARGFEFTPAGFVKAAKLRTAVGTEASEVAARASIGTAVMLGAATLALDDRLTASAPTDAAERDAFYASGKKPWSVKIGDDLWVPFAQLQPIATPLALVAAAHDGWKKTGEAPAVDHIAGMATEIGKYITDQSYMDSVGKFFDAISGGVGAAKAASDLTAQTAAGFMPLSGLSRTIARVVDPRLIETHGVGEKIKSQIPGASLGMQARLDVWGEEITPTGGRGRAVLAEGTPLAASREVDNPLNRELARIGLPLGYVGTTIFDPKLRRSEKLPPKDQHFYQQVAGRKTKEMLTNLFQNPAYQQADAEAQRKIVEHVVGTSRQYARMMYLRQKYGWS